MRYRRYGLAELLRIVARAIDLLVLLHHYTSDRGGLRSLRELYFVELGPGPTKLRWIKQRLFAKVTFVDWLDYGDGDVEIRDLYAGIPLPVDLHGLGEIRRTFYFADHCLEHLPLEITERFLSTYRGQFMFRVPNIRSELGRRDFQADPTHITRFDDDDLLRLRLRRQFERHFWSRLYSRRSFTKRGQGSEKRELCIYG